MQIESLDSKSLIEIIKIAWPLIAIQLALAALSIVDIVKKKETKNLSPVIWGIIVVFVNLFGPILYFLVGRVED